MSEPVATRTIAPLLAHLCIAPERVREIDGASAPSPDASAALATAGARSDLAAIAARLVEQAARECSSGGWLLVLCEGARTDVELARMRDALWPAWHVGALLTSAGDGVEQRTVEGRTVLPHRLGTTGVLVVARPRALVLAPATTTAKFDRNAAGWNGAPGKPGYAHFRWMRRFVAEMAGEHRARRILDFGSGAGWVGIEAALASRARGGDPALCAFDPSPELVRIAGENAGASGLTRFEGRVGFGEDPPFARDAGDRFDLVLSSGVVSFARDRELWFDGLARTVANGGTLVIGDIHPGSKGMRRRRAERPLLPIRELNAMTREEARGALEARGFRFEAWSGYQLSDPMPQWNHADATRLGGLFGPLLLAWNRRAAARSQANGGAGQDRFDSWAVRLRRA